MKFKNEIPIYLQLFKLIALDIVSGKYASGEKIPSVRDLAIIYKVNPNTVQKALSELESIRLIYTERTNGKFVTSDKKIIKDYLQSLAKESTVNYLKSMHDLGFSTEEVMHFIERNE